MAGSLTIFGVVNEVTAFAVLTATGRVEVSADDSFALWMRLLLLLLLLLLQLLLRLLLLRLLLLFLILWFVRHRG